MIERVFLLIDGSNFFHRLRELGMMNLLTFDYRSFAKFLIGNKRTVASQAYYIAPVREEAGNSKSRMLMRDQRIFMNNLQKHGWTIQFGHMLKTDRYHEKGVDVLMATDLLCGAYEDLYDTAILVSSDTDLIPAIQKVRSKGKKVEKEDLAQFLPSVS